MLPLAEALGGEEILVEIGITKAVFLALLVDCANIDGPLFRREPAQGCPCTGRGGCIDIVVDEFRIVEGACPAARVNRPDRTVAEHVVDITGFLGLEADEAQRGLVRDQRDIDHGRDVVTGIAVGNRVGAEIDPGIERGGIGLVGDDAQRAAL